MQCPSCGAQNGADAPFCLACRKTLTPALVPAVSADAWATPFYDRQVGVPTPIFAAFWDRVFALVIDAAVSFFVGAIPGIILLFILQGSGTAIAVLLLGWVFGAIAYQIVAVAYGGGFGMQAAGIRVVRAEDLTRPGFARSIVRFGARTIFGVVPFLGAFLGIGDGLWMIKDPYKQTWHDKVARTYVIER